MGRNISCNNPDCSNYRKKIGRVRGAFAQTSACPICHQRGIEHTPMCKVTKGNMIIDCNCHLRLARTLKTSMPLSMRIHYGPESHYTMK